MTEPGPVGVNVDPLGEALGPTPDGLCVEFGEVAGMDGPLGFVWTGGCRATSGRRSTAAGSAIGGALCECAGAGQR